MSEEPISGVIDNMYSPVLEYTAFVSEGSFELSLTGALVSLFFFVGPSLGFLVDAFLNEKRKRIVIGALLTVGSLATMISYLSDLTPKEVHSTLEQRVVKVSTLGSSSFSDRQGTTYQIPDGSDMDIKLGSVVPVVCDVQTSKCVAGTLSDEYESNYDLLSEIHGTKSVQNAQFQEKELTEEELKQVKELLQRGGG